MLDAFSRSRARATVAAAGLLAMTAALTTHATADTDDPRHPSNHEIHDPDRPQPPVVDPGPAGPPVPAPSDAIVLFDGTSFDHWEHPDGSAAQWDLADEGAMQVAPGTGDLQTTQTFGDAQLHVEFMTYEDSPYEAGRRSNSGVFFGPYEVQVLDSYENPISADQINASLYGQYPPLVNASRPPGQWQTFDIVYRAPSFDDAGQVTEPARMTVFHNNVLVHHNAELVGPTSHSQRTDYEAHGDVPIRLQDHQDDPLHFRNIWVRELE